VRRVDEKEGEQSHQRDATEYGTQRALHELTIHPPRQCTRHSFSAAWAAASRASGTRYGEQDT
jgi:hypothetical protein